MVCYRKACKSIVDSLKSSDVALRGVEQETVAVVQPGPDNTADNRLRDVK
jgi:hypothetical protein